MSKCRGSGCAVPPANLSHSISPRCSWRRPSLCLDVCLHFWRYLQRTKRFKGDESPLALAQATSWGEAELNTRKEGFWGGLDCTAETHIASIALPCLCVSGWENKFAHSPLEFCLRPVEVGSVWEGNGSETGLGCTGNKEQIVILVFSKNFFISNLISKARLVPSQARIGHESLV